MAVKALGSSGAPADNGRQKPSGGLQKRAYPVPGTAGRGRVVACARPGVCAVAKKAVGAKRRRGKDRVSRGA